LDNLTLGLFMPTDGEAVGTKTVATARPEELQKLATLIRKVFRENPPTIGVVGVSGVGKSSTINALFKTDLPTSDTVRCTIDFEHVDLEVEAKIEDHKHKARLRVIDAPGLGEDIRNDPDYLRRYKTHLGECDVILWVMAARNRAIALDQSYLQELIEFKDKMIFGLNQVDLIEPRDWNIGINLPSTEQEKKIEEIVADRKRRIEAILGKPATVVPYCANHKYMLVQLFSGVLNGCPDERRWIFETIKAVTPSGFLDKLPTANRELIDRGAKSQTVNDRFDTSNVSGLLSQLI
jgi:small GTP-binding protein